MTDRYSSLIVVLDRDIREDDAQPIVEAIRQLRGVRSVSPVVADYSQHVAEARARHDLGQALLKVIFPDAKDPK